MTKEEAKQWIESIKRKYIHGGDEEFDYKRKIALDMAIKALEQEPKTGHWIFQKITQGKRMYCSNCNSFFDLCCSQIKRYNKATGDDDMWMYCPWCGAKMVERGQA